MFARLTIVWDNLRSSLWAVPMAFVLGAVALAIAAVQLHLQAKDNTIWWLYSGDADAASGFLANMLSAMITMATLAISITMVVLALAAQSLGPRLISIFMGDIRTKAILGTLIGTSAYLLIVLRTIAGTSGSVPQLAVTLGTALVLASVILLLFFVHHLARSVVSDTVIARVGAALESRTATLPPKEAGGTDASATQISRAVALGSPIIAKRAGYIQAIDHAAIVEAARQANVIVAFTSRPGQFVLPGEPMARVQSADTVADTLTDAVQAAVVVGSERTAVQDLEYSVRQLVEIGLRALSPGVNDPFTACAVIDRLAGSLAHIMRRGPMQSVWRDDQNNIRLVVQVSTFAGLVDVAFNQIRQAGAQQAAILIRLAERLGELRHLADADAADALVRHLAKVRQTGERAIPDEVDRVELRARIDAALTPGSG